MEGHAPSRSEHAERAAEQWRVAGARWTVVAPRSAWRVIAERASPKARPAKSQRAVGSYTSEHIPRPGREKPAADHACEQAKTGTATARAAARCRPSAWQSPAATCAQGARRTNPASDQSVISGTETGPRSAAGLDRRGPTPSFRRSRRGYPDRAATLILPALVAPALPPAPAYRRRPPPRRPR